MSLTGDGERHGFQNTHILPSTNCRCASEAEVESPEDTQVAGKKKKRSDSYWNWNYVSGKEKRQKGTPAPLDADQEEEARFTILGDAFTSCEWVSPHERKVRLKYCMTLFPTGYSRTFLFKNYVTIIFFWVWLLLLDELFFDYNAWVSSMISFFFSNQMKWLILVRLLTSVQLWSCLFGSAASQWTS